MYKVLLACFFFLQLNSYSQISIFGKTRDTAGNALPSVIVVLKENISGPALKYSISDDKGNFKIITNIQSQEVVLEFSSVNYKKEYQIVKLTGTDIYISAVLHLNYTILSEIVIKADPSIKRFGDTTIFKVDSFKSGSEKNLSELLKKIPGFTVLENGKISYNGKTLSKVLFDSDDLTGSNYEIITKNLNIRSLENLKIIENYKDPENILANFENDKNVSVLNVEMKKDFIERITGDIQLAGDLSNYYIQKLQLTSMLRRFKALSFQEINNTGNLMLNSSRASKNVADYSGSDLTEIQLPNLSISSGISSFREVNSFQDIPGINSNSSILSSLNFFSRISERVSVRGKTEIYRDNINMSTSTTTSFLPPYPSLETFNNIEDNKKDKQFVTSLFINYQRKKDQIGIIARFKNLKNYYNTDADIYLKKGNENYNAKQNDFFVKVFLSHIINSSSYLTAYIQYSKQKRLGNYLMAPNLFDTLLFNNINYNDVNQDEQQYFSSLLFNALYLKKYKKHTFSLNISNEYSRNLLSNKITSGTIQNIGHVLSGDSINNYLFAQNVFIIKLKNNYNVNKRLSLNLDASILQRGSQFSNSNSFSQYKWKLLSSVGASIKTGSKNQIFFNANIDNQTQSLNEIGRGFEIKSITAIKRGVDTLIWKDGYALNFGFHHIDLFEKRFLWFGLISITNNPIVFISEPIINLFYTLNEYQVSDRRRTNYVGTFSFQKFSKNRKLNVSYTSTFFKTSNYNRSDSTIFQTKISVLENGIKVSYKPIEKVSIECGINYQISFQRSSIYINNLFPPQQITNKFNLDFRLSKNISYQVDGSYFIFYTQKKLSNHNFIINNCLNFNYSKISFGIKANNILNTRSFLQSNYSGISFTTLQYNIQQRIVLGYIKINF